MEESDRAQKEGLPTRQDRVDEMLLTAIKGDPLGVMLYNLGKANLHWSLWSGDTKTQQDGWRKEILEEADRAQKETLAHGRTARTRSS